MNLGEVLGVAINSKGQVMVLNHPGQRHAAVRSTATPPRSCSLFDSTGKFVKEVGKGVYGLAYGHSIRYDKYDNLWVVDKGTNAVTKFNPEGFTVMNLGRRPEGPDDPGEFYYRGGRGAAPPRPRRTTTSASRPTSRGIRTTTSTSRDGYTNSRIAKYDKNGNWVKSWGQRGPGGAARRTRIPDSSTRCTTSAIDRQNNVYVADRNNRRIQVFDRDGNFQRFIFLNADLRQDAVIRCSATFRPTAPDETQPWTHLHHEHDAAVPLHLGR